MNLSEILTIVVGLSLFEIISSIDNAIVDADVLATMSKKARKWFLFIGSIFAVFIVRGFLPLIIVYLSNPSLGLSGALTATFSNSESVRASIESSKPILLAGGGVYLIFLFFHWLFLETKDYAFFIEKHIHHKLSLWFYTVVSLVLLLVVWLTIRSNPFIALSAVVGSTAFFISSGFKKNAEDQEKEITKQHLSEISKILYLEIIDSTFSIDGVLGAFAFTISVPLILIGNGLGAFVMRYFTIHGLHVVKKYRYLKNGAMYSIRFLGLIMLLDSFGIGLASWLPTITTFLVVGLFLWLSIRELKTENIIKG